MKEVKYNGMYMPSSHDHEKWLEKVKRFQANHKNRRDNKYNNKPAAEFRSNASSFGSGLVLTLKDNIKAVLFMNCGMSKDQVQDMVEACNKSKK